MPVAIRLMRMGQIHRPVYRISVADSRRVPTGKFLEHIGTFSPHKDRMGNKQFRLNVARAKYWLAMGAQPSDAVARLFSRFHLIPLPPQRILVPTGAILHKVLAGEDVRGLIPKPGESAASSMSSTPLMQPPHPKDRHMKPLTEERKAQLVKQKATWKLQAFPFQPNPSEATMQAWHQARIFHKQIPSGTAMGEWTEEALKKQQEAWRMNEAEEEDEDEDEDEEEEEDDDEDDDSVEIEDATPEPKKTQ